MNYQDTEHHKVNYPWLLIIEFARLIIKKQKQTKKKQTKMLPVLATIICHNYLEKVVLTDYWYAWDKLCNEKYVLIDHW